MAKADHRLAGHGLLLLFAAMLLPGCATTLEPGILTYEGHAEHFLWPAAPEVARYQFVGQLTGERNFVRPESANKPGLMKRFFTWVTGVFSYQRDDPKVLQRPQGVVSDTEGRVYVTDVSKQAVYVFDKIAGTLNIWTNAAIGTRFHSPIGIALDNKGGVLVADAELGMVVRLDKDGNPQEKIGEATLNRPTGLALDSVEGHLYVADTGSHNIKVFDTAGNVVKVIGQRGEEQGDFNYPTYLHLKNDKLYVSDRMNSRVQVLSKGGEVLQVLGKRGRFLGDTPHPKGVGSDSDGNVYIVESFNDHMLIYNEKGKFLLPIGGTGQKPGEFFLPAGLWVDEQDRIYVADMFNGRIVVFKYLGED